MKTHQDIIKDIQSAKRVSNSLRETFFGNRPLSYIRNWLERNGINRNIPIELYSIEIAILTPKGIWLEKENGQISLFETNVQKNELDKTTVTEILSRTGIEFEKKDIEFVEFTTRLQRDENKEQTYFYIYRFVVKTDLTPETINDFRVISPEKRFDEISLTPSYQREFILYLFDAYYS